MLVDYNPAQGSYFVRVPRKGTDVALLMREHGLDFSQTGSSSREALLLTKEPYAAAGLGAEYTPRARHELEYILDAIDKSWKPDSGAHFKVPADQELWGFQKASLEYALPRKHSLIGDQPGLGKTPMAVTFANEIGAKRVLVICPASIRTQWVEKINAWTTMRWPYYVHAVIHGRRGVHPDAQWTVVSYDLARSPAIWRALASYRYDLLILDEAHYLKTPDARRTRSIFGGGKDPIAPYLAGLSEHILALTGTPLPNRPREAYTLARGLCFEAIDWQSEEDFRDRFNPSYTGWTADDKTYVDERTGRHGELQARLRANFMVRHLKRDVMTQLKMPVYDIIRLETTATVKAALQKESLLHFNPDTFDTDIPILGDLSTVRKEMGIAMAPQVADYIDMLIDGGEEKLVVFAWHIEVLNMLEEAWQRHGVVRVDGSTSNFRKTARIKEFQTNPRCQIILGNTLSLGTGTDGLQLVSCHALIAEPDWVPGNNIQAFDRLDRGGQLRSVQGDIFVAPGSIAEKVLGTALHKLQITHKALDKRSAV